jgi:DNA-directed RNA polymerase specialized sigma subunit
MANSESQKRQLQAQIYRTKDVIKGLQEKLSENPNDRSAREELRRQKQELQGLTDELNNTE